MTVIAIVARRIRGLWMREEMTIVTKERITAIFPVKATVLPAACVGGVVVVMTTASLAALEKSILPSLKNKTKKELKNNKNPRMTAKIEFANRWNQLTFVTS